MKNYLLLLLLLTSLSTFAQKTKWVKSLGGQNLDEGFECTVSNNGDLLFCGTIMDTSEIDGVTIETQGQDFYVAKSDTNGKILWVITGGGTDDGSCYAYALATDASNNVYVGGKFACTMEIDGTTYPVSNTGINDAFLLKADSQGNILWVKTYSGSANIMIERIDVDEDGLAVAIRYVGTLTIDDQTFSSDYPNVSNGTNGAIIALTTDGDFQWGLKVNAYSSFIRDVKIGSTGDVFFTTEVKMTGTTSPFITPVGGTTITPIGNPLGGSDVYLSRINRSTGAISWINRIGSEGSEMSYCIDLDANDNPYCGILYQGEIQLTSQTESMKKIDAVGSSFDMLVFKYSATGDLIWTDAQGSENIEGIYDIAVNENGYVYVSAYMLSNGTYINGDSLKVETGNGAEAILMSYTTEGKLNWYLPTSTYYTDEDGIAKSLCRIWGVSIADNNQIFLTGTYTGQGTFLDTTQFPNSGIEKDVFYALFDPEDVKDTINDDTTAILSHNTVDAQIYYNNNFIYSNSASTGEISIYNALGQLCQYQQYNGNPVNIAQLPNGIYIVRLRTNKNDITTQKIFKN